MPQPRRSRIVRSPGVVVAVHGDRTVLVNVRRGRRLPLNELEARVWELLVDGPTAPVLVERLRRDYEVRPEPLATDVSALLSRWLELGLIAWL